MSPVPEPAARGPLPAATATASPAPWRLPAAIGLGAAAAALGGLILGEYPFTGVMPYIAGVLFGLVVAEVIVSVSQQQGKLTALAAAVCSAGGLGWAVWISAGKGVDPIPIGGWVAIGIGTVVALFRGGIRAPGWPGRSSRPYS